MPLKLSSVGMSEFLINLGHFLQPKSENADYFNIPVAFNEAFPAVESSAWKNGGHMTRGNVKNIRPRYVVALAIMAVACAIIVGVSIRTSDQNTRIARFSDAVSESDRELNELAKMAMRLTGATAPASRQSYQSAIDNRILDIKAVIDNLEATWPDLPDRLKSRIAAESNVAEDDPFRKHRDLIEQGTQIFTGDAAVENQNATRLSGTYQLINLPMTKDFQKSVRAYTKEAADAAARFNYGFSAVMVAILIGIGVFIFVPMERTIKRQIVEMEETLDEVRTMGRRAARVRAALNDASSAALIVDVGGAVTFANKSMIRLADDLAGDFAATLDGFAALAVIDQEERDRQPGEGAGETPDEAAKRGEGRAVSALVGMEFNRLHTLAAMRADQLLQAEEAFSERMVEAGRTLELTASPVFDEASERLGSVIEWKDLTAQVAVEREIAEIVHSAGDGDFTKRLTKSAKSGFMADLANGMNELLDVVDNGLSQTVRVISALAAGNLTERMQGEHKGAFGMLRQDVDRMAGQMEAMLGRIAGVTGAVELATDDISSGIADLSARTEHQASSLEETTVSMEELSATVRQNAENAQEANQVASAAREAAVTGGEVADRAVAAMGGIEASSLKIGEIVGLIQEIAFQTNLLALNASVEAARAGEAGRGFAVVANEVRGLAQRAANASKDIKELITNSGSQVEEGVKLVNEAGTALDEIVAAVKKVADFVSEIANASQEQTSGIDQVSAAISGMDEMTQQNAALVEETTAAIQSAREQVGDLQSAVNVFRTSGSASVPSGDGEVDTPENPLHGIAEEMARIVGDPADNSASPAPSRAAAPGVTVAAVADEASEWEEF
jgi:methyl-accepting chemotaxis protein